MKTLITISIILGILIIPIITLFAGAIFLYTKAITYSVNKTLDNIYSGNNISFSNINYLAPQASFLNSREIKLKPNSNNDWSELAAKFSAPELEKTFVSKEFEEKFIHIIRESM